MELITNFQFLTTVNTTYNKTKKMVKIQFKALCLFFYLFIKSKRH